VTPAGSASDARVSAWVACWADVPDDAMSSKAGHVLIPGGRWMLERLVPFLESRDAQFTGIGFEYSGYWWVRVARGARAFRLFVYYVEGVGNVRVVCRRSLWAWLTRRDSSAEVGALAELVIEALRAEPRVRRVARSPSYVDA
jgi:hypothetical protein